MGWRSRWRAARAFDRQHRRIGAQQVMGPDGSWTYHGRCRCGWVGPARDSPFMAGSDEDTHLDKLLQQRRRPPS